MDDVYCLGLPHMCGDSALEIVDRIPVLRKHDDLAGHSVRISQKLLRQNLTQLVPLAIISSVPHRFRQRDEFLENINFSSKLFLRQCGSRGVDNLFHPFFKTRSFRL